VHLLEAAKWVLVIAHFIVRDGLDLLRRYGLGDAIPTVSVRGDLFTVELRGVVANEPQMRGTFPSRKQYGNNVVFPVTYFDGWLAVGHSAECLEFPDRERDHIQQDELRRVMVI
jgi:hypothetical protein